MSYQQLTIEKFHSLDSWPLLNVRGWQLSPHCHLATEEGRQGLASCRRLQLPRGPVLCCHSEPRPLLTASHCWFLE